MIKLYKTLVSVSMIFGMLLFNGCCDDVAKAELYIKKAQQLFDYFGRPIINVFTGQPVTQQLPNALFYNERTGEYFNPEFGSSLPTLIGDVIQFATTVTNEYGSLGDCQNLKQSVESNVGMPLNFIYPDGSTELFSLYGKTPPINPGGGAYGVGKFQIAGPGFVAIETTRADVNDDNDEWDENNNITQIGVQTSVGGRRSGNLIRIEGSQTLGEPAIKQIPLNVEPSQMEIFLNMNSKKFSEFIMAHYSEKLNYE